MWKEIFVTTLVCRSWLGGRLQAGKGRNHSVSNVIYLAITLGLTDVLIVSSSKKIEIFRPIFASVEDILSNAIS
jgi:hypothetical protein